MVEPSEAEAVARIGVVIGKFEPPHLGHLALVEFAARACHDRLHVIVCERGDEAVEANVRACWLLHSLPDDLTPRVTFHCTIDDLPETPVPWARRTLAVLAEDPPDAAFTSEEYGPTWAAAMGIRHVQFDLARRRVPTSGTAVRAEVVGRFGDLVPAARAGLARRIVVVGAESTGKTTLASDLARVLRSDWVPEYGRLHWAERPVGAPPTTDEFLHIARTQRDLVDFRAHAVTVPWIVVDTDALVTAVWHQRYVGQCDARLEAEAGRRPQLYVVCGDELPWTQDGTRESRDERAWMQQDMVARVVASDVPWVTVNGSREHRVMAALEAIKAHCPAPDLSGPTKVDATVVPPPTPEVRAVDERLRAMVAASCTPADRRARLTDRIESVALTDHESDAEAERR